MTPREKDSTGLSFSLTPPATGKYVVTTMESVNSTGVLVAIKDGANHVSVRPTNMFSMSGWIDSRPSAEIAPHAYTIILKTITSPGM